MFIVPVYVHKSELHGLGLYASQLIPKGTLIWEFHPKFDIVISPEEWNNFPVCIRESLEVHAWQCVKDGPIYYEATAGKYINHSDTPNTDFKTDRVGYATRDIQAYEEIFSDYREFMADTSQLEFLVDNQMEHTN